MDDAEIAAFLRDQLRRRLSGPDQALVEAIADGEGMTPREWSHFEHLKTQFAAELANAGKGAAR